jgi:N-acylneuraminate cytidylyltransferase
MNALAIILARGGSKRIPRKNVRPFLGRPILAYAIEAARESGCFSEVMVSTDDAEIAEIGRECGAVVPALRSQKNSTDQAGSEEAMHEVILEYRQRGCLFAHACAIYATAALTTSDHLRRGFSTLDADRSLTTVLPIVRFSYPVQRALALRDGRVPMMHPEHYDSRSQDLEPAYHDAGQWYWLRTEKFLRTKELMGPHTAGVVISELETQDIDTEDDWALAELKFQHRVRASALA